MLIDERNLKGAMRSPDRERERKKRREAGRAGRVADAVIGQATDISHSYRNAAYRFSQSRTGEESDSVSKHGCDHSWAFGEVRWNIHTTFLLEFNCARRVFYCVQWQGTESIMKHANLNQSQHTVSSTWAPARCLLHRLDSNNYVYNVFFVVVVVGVFFFWRLFPT